MNWQLYLRRARELPTHVVVRKAAALALRCAARQTRLIADYFFSTYALAEVVRNPATRLVVRAEDIAADLEAALLAFGQEYFAHRFDLLGSGWRAPTYGFRAYGFLGRRYDWEGPERPGTSGDGLEAIVTWSNLRHSRQCWWLIRGKHYEPIDWQLDFRSGYRWSAQRHSYRCLIPADTGADVKVPWELGRLQHLPQLALCAVLGANSRSGFEPASRYVEEISDQLIDFIAANPPRFGVNWMSAMDVAIRAANIALTLALLAGADRGLSPAVEAIVMPSLNDHARYVREHLDYSESGRSNHYVCEIAGLLWACWIMGASAERDAWLEFAATEIEKEARVQFLADGGNYEGSTNYHRLSGEAVLFSVGVLEALGRPVSRETLAVLRKAAQLSQAVQGDDGTIVQIGDTDSGRFFKLHPTVLAATSDFVENTLDHEGFVQGVNALFARPSSGARLEAVAIHRLVGKELVGGEIEPPTGDFGDLDALEAEMAGHGANRVRRIPLGGPVEEASWQRFAFSDFGLYVFRHGRRLIAFRCFRGLSPTAPSGHTHDDNLGLEYRLDAVDRRDPGSFVYTPDVKQRNAYRAAAAHDVPRAADWAVAPPGGELFALDHRAYATCLAWRSHGVAGEIRTPQGRFVRIVRLTRTELVVTDCIEPPQEFAALAELPIARGYGRL